METISEIIVLLKYIILGLVQGFTEPIPISSSGHVLVIRKLFDLHIEGLSFEIIVNLGSLIAVFIIYWKDILRLINNSINYLFTKNNDSKADFHFIFYLIVATIPTGLIGLLFEDYISSKFSTLFVVGVTLLITGSALWMIRKLCGYKNDADITIRDAVIIGLAQSVALIPGISRSGATIVAAMLLGMNQATALRFSFLLYIPVSLGVTFLSIKDIVSDPQFDLLIIPYLLAFMASIIATFYSLKWFMNVMAKGNLKYFSFYCFIAGILIIFLL